MQNFHDWVAGHDVAYETIWNDDDAPDSRFRMVDHAHVNGPFASGSDFPNAEATYMTAFATGFGLPLTSTLEVSLAPDRASPMNLANTALTGDVYIFSAPGSGSGAAVAQVDFYLDGALVHTETGAPYDYAGTNGADANPATFTPGFHIVRAITTFADGTTATESATFSAR